MVHKANISSLLYCLLPPPLSSINLLPLCHKISQQNIVVKYLISSLYVVSTANVSKFVTSWYWYWSVKDTSDVRKKAWNTWVYAKVFVYVCGFCWEYTGAVSNILKNYILFFLFIWWCKNTEQWLKCSFSFLAEFQVHRWLSRFILCFEEVPHGEHPRSCWWFFCILSFTSSTTAAHFPVGFMEEVILVISLPKASFLLLPILSPQRAFIKVMQAHVISMFVWIHACMHIRGTFTSDKCCNKQNFSHRSVFLKRQINEVIATTEIFFFHFEENACRYDSFLLGSNQYVWICHVVKTEGNEKIKSMKLCQHIQQPDILRKGY